MTEKVVTASLDETIKDYIRMCNEGDAEAIARCFCPDAIHYFPKLHKWSGALAIGRNFSKLVRELGYFWTVDQILAEPAQHIGVLEWTQFQTKDRILRGIDWFVFKPHSSLILEIRTYVASPVHPDLSRQELEDFDYSGRGYPTSRT